MASTRHHPNIIITGTPGCGKSSHAESLALQLKHPYTHYNVSDLAKENKWLESYDEELDTHVVDEDKLLDDFEQKLRAGGAIVDWHCCDIFPERLIDLVVVLRTDNSVLYDRLKKRNYKDNKIQENLDCEIMDVIQQDASDAYMPQIVISLLSNTADELDDNVDRIAAWVDNWSRDHPDGVTNELDASAVDSDSELE